MLSIDYSGRVALITGAAQGIGRAAAQAFVEAGAQVLLADCNASVEAVAEEIERHGGKAKGFRADVTDSGQCGAMVDAAVNAFGRLDYAFNNAGIGSYPQPVHEVDDERWQRVIDTNLSGVFHCVKHEVPPMLESGGGVIVNNASVLGIRAIPQMSVEYTAAKHGVIGLTRQLAVNHGAEGIRCLAVCPGLIDTSLISSEDGGGISAGGIDDETRAWIMARTPQQRIGTPDDIARMVVLLCSPEAEFINGTHILVDGALNQG